MNHVRHTVAALASACLLAACGGAGDEGTAPSPTTTAASTATLQLEGCVVDPRGRPLATRVHAFGDDGRLIANATSNAAGLFVMQVPADAPITVALDAPGNEQLPLLTGHTRLSLGGCLSEGSA